MNQNPEIEKLNKKAKDYSKMLKGIHAEMSKVIVGQDAVIENLILALATQGHVLLKGVPGLAKTLLIKTLADCIDLDFVRLQFTPDLLPADIIGTKIYDHNTTSYTTACTSSGVTYPRPFCIACAFDPKASHSEALGDAPYSICPSIFRPYSFGCRVASTISDM